MLDASFTVADHFLDLHGHAGPPELVLQQVQNLLLTLVSSISVTFIHSSHSMSCGDYKLCNFFQLASWCMVVIEGSLIEHQLFLLLKDSHSLLSVCIISQKMLQILYFLVRDPIDCGLSTGSSH